ncbi:hypothetical protein L211DRAFT_141222 [Terfezia boudieri ATCC MYA-4762]|uniref:Uncharacterized protein n=1 Tax=Terfezia boudieri ATCC MYA-4762 TaxID=1051890 RepID=A0A3N4L9S2_9PEZI|nr:hypothetical protein L211DRAFT_141222 [Terfezia boudieri ATCC MYA-4762]
MGDGRSGVGIIRACRVNIFSSALSLPLGEVLEAGDAEIEAVAFVLRESEGRILVLTDSMDTTVGKVTSGRREPRSERENWVRARGIDP